MKVKLVTTLSSFHLLNGALPNLQQLPLFLQTFMCTLKISILCGCVFCMKVYLYIMSISGVQAFQGGSGSPGIGVMHGCEPPHKFWELNLVLLEEWPVFLTTEPSLWSP